jgi:DNA replication and repair protein RecF
MIIKSIEIENYRNYEKQNIIFDDKTNIIYGDNAQGKTNILEALFIAATTKSHKNSKDKDIIEFGSEEAHIRVNLKKREVGHRIDMHLRKNGSKGAAIDGISIKRSTELFGMINIIFFSPEDLSVVKNGPGERRRFMDMEICQLSRLYYSNLLNYNKVLDQRNSVLRQIYFNPSLKETLDIWDDQLVQYGSSVIRERRNFLNMLNDIIKDIHSNLTSDKEKIEIVYEPNISEDAFLDCLKQKREADIKNSSTLTGPQRDDFGIIINGKDVRVFGSQGQQRTAALSLKLAEIELVKKIINDSPVLLLDDVMSELDSKRRDSLLNSLNGIQTIITCTGYDDFIKERISIDKIYNVENGVVREVRNGTE